MKKELIGLSYGELILKGKNRGFFINSIKRHLKTALRDIEIQEEFSQMGKLFIVPANKEDLAKALKAAMHVFGFIYISPGLMVDKEERVIREAAIELMKKKMAELRKKEALGSDKISFKVKVKRADKSFPIKSPQIAADLGADLLDAIDDLYVDVRNPQITLYLDIREDAFLYTDRYEGMGGLPAASAGRGLLLLSGGIDSPVAAYQLAKRGLAPACLHFHSYPFTSERAKDKAIRLAEQLSKFTGPTRLYMVNLLDSYTAINKNCNKKNTTILSRRMMMRVADELADKYGYQCLISGESLGQVASQTVQGIGAVNQIARYPILRPLIAMDKKDIIKISRDIETYDISIEPYDDCCSIFAPDHPNTRPRIADILADEKKLDIDSMLKKALDSLEIIDIV